MKIAIAAKPMMSDMVDREISRQGIGTACKLKDAIWTIVAQAQSFRTMLEQRTSSSVIYLRFRSLSSEVYGEHCLRTQRSRDSSCTQEDFLRYTDLVSSQLHVRRAKVVCLGSVRVPIPEKVRHVLLGSWTTD